jgi:hypothetical protein
MVSNSLIINNVLNQGTVSTLVITVCYKLEDLLRGVARLAIRFQYDTYLNDKKANVTHESK